MAKIITTAESTIVNQLVSAAFGYQSPHTFFDDFPVWGSEQAERFGIFEGSTLISHVGIRKTSLRDGNTEIPIGLVGAVATDVAYRGQGHSTKLLEQIIIHAERMNLSWLVLWGSEHHFYGKFGFHLAGAQARVKLDDILLRSPPKLSFRTDIQTGYDDKIFEYLIRHPENQSVCLKNTDQAWFQKHKTVKWFWIKEPFAFIGFERGMDLPHLIHEWGGDSGSLLSLLKHVQQLDPVAEVMTHTRFFQKLGLGQTAPHIDEKLCLAKAIHATGGWPDHYWISGLNAC